LTNVGSRGVRDFEKEQSPCHILNTRTIWIVDKNTNLGFGCVGKHFGKDMLDSLMN